MRVAARAASIAAFIVAAAIPAFAQAQAAGTICKDGTSSAVSGRGACSGHGGVDAVKTKAATTASPAMVMCTDGTSSKAGRGACSGHGGMKGMMTAATPAAPKAMTAPEPAHAPMTPKPAKPATAATAATSPMASTGGSGAKEDNNPTGATAKCKDGMYSHSAHRQGACSRHGGVATWMAQ